MSFDPESASMMIRKSVPLEVAHPDIQNAYMQYLEQPSQKTSDRIGETSQYLEDYAKENNEQTFRRALGNIGKRVGEGVLGGANFLVGTGYNSVAGLLNSLGDAFLTEEEQKKPSVLPYAKLPTAKDYREAEKKRTGIKHEPRSTGEAALQEGASDLSEMATTIGATKAIPFLRGVGNLFTQAVLPVVTGVGGKYAAKGLGATDKEADSLKNVAMFLTSFAGNSNAPEISRRAMNAATEAVPQTAMANSAGVRGVLHNIMNQDWFRTMRGPEKNRAIEFIDQIYERSLQGNLSVRDLIQYRKDLNMARQQLGAFRPFSELTSGQRAVARRHLDRVDEALNAGIEQYGRTNPQWLRQYRIANQAYAVTSGSQYLADTIKNSPVLKHLQSDIVRGLFSGAGTGAASMIGATLPMAGVIGGGLSSAMVLNRVLRSPLLRRHYTQVLTQASIGNHESLEKALLAFDKAAKKSEKSTRNTP